MTVKNINVNRAYSTLKIKSMNEESREIVGIASAPGTDREGDIVEPMGASFTLPIPLLWQHDKEKPIGHVTSAKVTEKGIEVVAQLVKPDGTGKLAERLEEAWQSIKSGLVRGLSVGFQPVKYSFMDGGGVHFEKWNWFELSAVTIPANSEATITMVKSLDMKQSATDGKKTVSVVDKNASVLATKQFKFKQGESMKTIAEQIKEFMATRVTKAAEQSAIMQKSADSGETLNAEQSEQFDTLQDEITAIDKHVDRLKMMEKAQAQTATPAANDQEQRVKSLENGRVFAQVKNTQKLAPGIAFARAAKCLALGHLEHRDAISIAQKMYDGQDGVIKATQQLVTKAAVPAATTDPGTWAGNLVGTDTSAFADFVEFLRPQTIIGRFGSSGVPALRNVPFRTPLIGQTSGGDGYWVGEGQAKPLTKFDFSRTTLEPLKVANIAVATMEVIRDSSPAADNIIRDQLAAALRERLDIDFIDPAKAAVSGISPASILNGVAAIPAAGTGTADDVRTDAKAVFGAFIAANNAPSSGVWIMSATNALALSLMYNPLGGQEFPGISMSGGTLFGLPVIVSEFVASGSVALVNTSDIYVGDEGGIDLSMSTEASLQMDNAPANPTVAETVLVSLWQRNLVGFRAERTINWARRRDSAVAHLSGVAWGA